MNVISIAGRFSDTKTPRLFCLVGLGCQKHLWCYKALKSMTFHKNKNMDAQLAGLMFIAAQSARARRMRIAHSFLSYRKYLVTLKRESVFL